ncbi:MAG: hypothetical protein J7L45_02910, partial [Candidatus Aenigmarchaeota archaeon]|nr:hypothetical protein [Candidatus Aenigmarchaeota archaeon]
IDLYEGIQRFKPLEERLFKNVRIRFRYEKNHPIDDRVDLSEEDIINICKKLDYWSKNLADVDSSCEPALILGEDYQAVGIIRKNHCEENYMFIRLREDFDDERTVRLLKKSKEVSER